MRTRRYPADIPAVNFRSSLSQRGFTVLELVVVLGIIALISLFALPSFTTYYAENSLKAVIRDIQAMIREARLRAMDDQIYAIAFDVVQGKVSLVSGRGPDGSWNTADDVVARSFKLSERGGGITFGHGSYGPIPGYAAASDGVTFQSNNTLVCNTQLTGSSGTIYLRAACGAAMALTVNSTDFGWTLRRWNGTSWVKA